MTDQPSTSQHVTSLATSTDTSPISPRALADIPAIVARYQQGESLQVIAAESAVSVRTIYRWMMSELGDRYPHVVTETLIDRIADADMALESATDMCQIARAQHRARYARMDLERRRPELYGEKRQVKTDSTINVIIQRDTKENAVQPSELVRTSTNNNIIDVPQVVDNAGE